MKIDVTFPSSNLTIAGILFLPDAPATERLAAVVVGHPGGGVKEQTASIYAERLAREGFAALVFDAAYQGESEGEPRGLENPFQRAEDVKSAVSFLSTRDEIDPGRIGALGICASGGYVPYAAQTDVRIRAVATVSGSDMGTVMRDGLGGGQSPETLRAMLEASTAARTAEARGGGVVLQEWITDAVDEETYEYYRTPRGFHPRAVPPWPVRSVDLLVQYDSYALIHLIAPRPLLMIIGSEANTAYMSREAIRRAAEPKELFVVEGGTHISMYDRDEHVTPAVAKLTTFFTEHLA
ncbi:alpha/beta hydrolase [Actinoplanes sp. LDG1-06]|uniref:Alpha/beta hydrolase n=1 Tax=Paractinoplanes ovalisporus TaxID=2810368 RepID=A0ABS2AIP5_9ACTN|nr:alpha/beta hydrolase [Actinoplanes ovalisporus]MBM2619727.1 alpha/beta hydrolase [Actinoplanes ovalisporus]